MTHDEETGRKTDEAPDGAPEDAAPADAAAPPPPPPAESAAPPPPPDLDPGKRKGTGFDLGYLFSFFFRDPRVVPKLLFGCLAFLFIPVLGIGLVALARRGTRVRPFVPGLADPMGQMPGGGLPDAEVAMQLHARHALEAGREQENGHGPSVVAKFGSLHQGTGLGREVLAAPATAVRLGLAGGPRLDIAGAAGRTAHAVGPEDRREPARHW